MLGLTPDPLSAGVGMHVAVAGPYGHERVTAWAGRCRRATEEYRRGFRFVWPSTRAGRRPRPPVANDRLRHRRIGSALVSKADGSQSLDLQRDALQAAGVDAVNVYHDVATGARDDRPGLDSCMRARRAGDVLVVWKLARLGRFLYCFLPNFPDSGSD